MTEHAEDIGALKTSVEVLWDDSKRHTKSNEKRKDDDQKRKDDIAKLVLNYDMLSGVVTGMEEIKESIASLVVEMNHMGGRVSELENVSNDRITALEDRKFTIVGLLQGMVKPLGAAVTISICFMIITAIIVFSGNGEYLDDFFETVKAAKQ